MAEDKKNILERIVERTRATVQIRKGLMPPAVLERYPFFNRQPLAISDRFKAGMGAADPVEVATAYARYGASAISVLTDEPFFGGSMDDLMRVREAVDIPVLRKDFIIDEYQVLEAKAIGADLVLLIAACLSSAEVKQLAAFARNLGLEVLLELHDSEELGHICENVNLVGINNRSLKTFDVDLQRSLDMAARIPGSYLKVAESGIHNIDQVKLFQSNGFSAFLMGEHFMKEADPGEAFRRFASQL